MGFLPANFQLAYALAFTHGTKTDGQTTTSSLMPPPYGGISEWASAL